MEIENWKSIYDYRNYLVSDLGNIKSLKNGINLKFTENKSGHLSVLLYNEYGKKRFHVHRIVAEHFHEKIEGLDIVLHIVSNPKDNRAVNLKWGTRSENAKQAYKEGKIKVDTMKGKLGKFHHKSKPVIQKSLDGTFIKQWESVRQIQREIGLSQANISKCCVGVYHQAYGFSWEYFTK